MAQFDRIYRLTVGIEGSDGVVIEALPRQQGLSIGFDIDRTLPSKPINAGYRSLIYRWLQPKNLNVTAVCACWK